MTKRFKYLLKSCKPLRLNQINPFLGRYQNYGAITWFASQLLNDSLVHTVNLPAKIWIEDCWLQELGFEIDLSRLKPGHLDPKTRLRCKPAKLFTLWILLGVETCRSEAENICSVIRFYNIRWETWNDHIAIHASLSYISYKYWSHWTKVEVVLQHLTTDDELLLG